MSRAGAGSWAAEKEVSRGTSGLRAGASLIVKYRALSTPRH